MKRCAAYYYEVMARSVLVKLQARDSPPRDFLCLRPVHRLSGSHLALLPPIMSTSTTAAPLRHGRKPIYPDNDAQEDGLDNEVTDEPLSTAEDPLLPSSRRQRSRSSWYRRVTQVFSGSTATHKRHTSPPQNGDASSAPRQRACTPAFLTSFQAKHPWLALIAITLFAIFCLGLILLIVAILHLVLFTLKPPTSEVQAQIVDQSLILKGPDAVELLNISDDGILVRVQGRLGLDPDHALDLWLGRDEELGWWKRKERRWVEWTMGRVGAVRVDLGELVIAEPDWTIATDEHDLGLIKPVHDKDLLSDDSFRSLHDSPPMDLLSFHIEPLLVPIPPLRRSSSLSKPPLHPLNLTFLLRPVSPAPYLLTVVQKAVKQRRATLDVKVASLDVFGISRTEIRKDPQAPRLGGGVAGLVRVGEQSIRKRVVQKLPNLKNSTHSGDVLNLTRYDFFEIDSGSAQNSGPISILQRALGIKAVAVAKNPLGKLLHGHVDYSLPFGIYLPVEQPDEPPSLQSKSPSANETVLLAVVASQPLELTGAKQIPLEILGRVVPPAPAVQAQAQNAVGFAHMEPAQHIFHSGPGALPRPETNARTLDRSPQQQALSNFLSRFLRGDANTVYVRGGSPFTHPSLSPGAEVPTPDLPGTGSAIPPWLDSSLRLLDLPLSFPGAKVGELIKNVTISDLKIVPHPFEEEKLLCSGTILGEMNLPGQLATIDVQITKLWPDILVFDGPPPGLSKKPHNESRVAAFGDDEEPAPPLPDPLPKKAFARVRPHTWAPAETIVDPSDPEGKRKLLRSKLVDVPFQVLPGRGPLFRSFTWKILSGDGALAGIEGASRAKIWNSGLGELELAKLPVKGAFRVGNKRKDDDDDDDRVWKEGSAGLLPVMTAVAV